MPKGGVSDLCEIWLFRSDNALMSSEECLLSLYGDSIISSYEKYLTDYAAKNGDAFYKSYLCNAEELIRTLTDKLNGRENSLKSKITYSLLRSSTGETQADGPSLSLILSLILSAVDNIKNAESIDVILTEISKSYNVSLRTKFPYNMFGHTYDITALSECIPMSYLKLSTAMYAALKSGVNISTEISDGYLTVNISKISDTYYGKEFKHGELLKYIPTSADAAVEFIFPPSPTEE